MSTFYEMVTNSEGKIVRLDKLDSENCDIRRVISINNAPVSPNTYCQISKVGFLMSTFQGLEKREPGDPAFLLKLLASIAQRQSERL